LSQPIVCAVETIATSRFRRFALSTSVCPSATTALLLTGARYSILRLDRTEVVPMSTPDATRPRMRPFLPATADFAGRTDSPREFLERCLAGLEAWEPKIGAFVILNLPAARTAADRSTERWRAGRPLSPIDGMPVGVKDIIETIDMPTGNGSPLFEGVRTNRDAASVAALREAGALILGKTVTTEFAWLEPRATRNPWDFNRTPGGSSSGSAAAVAVGAVSAALGTQVVGSILRPASFCGCFGFKPTVGAINRGGAHDFLSQSAHGPLAASLADAWAVAWEIARRAGGDPGFPGLYGPPACPAPMTPRRLAVLETDGWAAAAPAAKDAFKEASARLKSAGVTLASRHESKKVAAAEDAIKSARELSVSLIAFESRWPLNTYRARDPSKLSQAMLDLFARGEAMSLDDYRQALADRGERRRAYRALEAECDACLTLAAPGAAPVGLGSTGDPAFVVPGSMLGVPAISLPALSDGGLPLGLQVLGFADADAALFSVAGGVLDLLQWDGSAPRDPAR
jgi:Asp-tRNA(Asn)/Glu-tRNA(Gln) amidotransferase A subunit family amidase